MAYKPEKPPLFVLLCSAQKLACYQQKNRQWQLLPLQGEDWLPAHNEQALAQALLELNKIHNHKQQLQNVQLMLAVDADTSAAQIGHTIEQAFKLNNSNWQILSLDKASSEQATRLLLDDLFYRINLLQTDSPKELLETREELEQTKRQLETLQQQAGQLKQEKQQTAIQLKTLQRQYDEAQTRFEHEKQQIEQKHRMNQKENLEPLITLLPALYKNFWTSIGPEEFAQIAGILEKPDIPSPFPEPSQATLLALKKRLNALTHSEREWLLAFCRALPHRLVTRPGMEYFFEDAGNA